MHYKALFYKGRRAVACINLCCETHSADRSQDRKQDRIHKAQARYGVKMWTEASEGDRYLSFNGSPHDSFCRLLQAEDLLDADASTDNNQQEGNQFSNRFGRQSMNQ